MYALIAEPLLRFVQPIAFPNLNISMAVPACARLPPHWVGAHNHVSPIDETRLGVLLQLEFSFETGCIEAAEVVLYQLAQTWMVWDMGHCFSAWL
mmetsp:Transcript_1051/g.3177  ORF Transcript_1051/g.3177 Transcript_1051/m.3177 type:complete len:95 (+) Transcript_1051:1328-1612(+)